MDDSVHMAPFWDELKICIARCVLTTVQSAEDGYVSWDDYFPYGEGIDEDDLREEPDIEAHQEQGTINLAFLNSDYRSRSIIYANTVLRAFNSVIPSSDRTPLGSSIFDAVCDLYPCLAPSGPALPIHIIAITVVHTTEPPEANFESMLMALAALDIPEENVCMTVYQVGSSIQAARKLADYQMVFNTWGNERDWFSSELSFMAHPEGEGDGSIDANKLLFAAQTTWDRRGTV